MSKILFISHDAYHTGAPILLLNLIRLLKQKGYSINTLVKNPEGPLLKEFAELSGKSSTIYKKRNHSRLGRLVALFKKQSLNDISTYLSEVEVIFNNTITNGDILTLIKNNTSAKIVTYVHELEVASQVFTTPSHIDHTLAFSDLFLVPCVTVRKFLIAKYNISPQKILILNYFIPPAILTRNTPKNKEKFVVGGCGTTDWRKGFDIFLLIAKKVVSQLPDATIIFKWKGIQVGSESHIKALYDIHKLGLEAHIELLESSRDVQTFYETLHLFLLPSREDPYPLVVLEAAACGVPTVCFDGAGGAVEFVEKNAGKIVPYLSIDSMATAVIEYYSNRILLASDGENASHKLITLHQDEELILQQFSNVLLQIHLKD